MQKFVETSGDKDVGKVNEWLDKCRKEEIPYIIIEKYVKYATVRWDYISYPPDMDKQISGNHNNYLDDVVSIFKKYSNNKSKINTNSGGLIHFDNIEIDKSHDCANEIFDIASKICE